MRAGTLDLKAWKPWKYEDNLCVMCQVKEETIDNFFKCKFYESDTPEYEEVFGNDPESQFTIAKEAKKRLKLRQTKTEEVGQDSLPAPRTPELSVEL